MLFLVLPLLPGWSSNRRLNQLPEPPYWMAGLSAGSAAGLPDVPFLSPLPGKARE